MRWTEGREQIKVWFEVGLIMGAHHMLVLFDEKTEQEYPIYVVKGSARAVYTQYTTSNHVVVEVYSMGDSMEDQLAEPIAMHLGGGRVRRVAHQSRCSEAAPSRGVEPRAPARASADGVLGR